MINMHTDILAPAAALLAWTLVMLFWVLITRIPAMRKAGIDMSKPTPGGRHGANLEGVLPDAVMWKAHNYNHLHEQPTLFYATLLVLAVSGTYAPLDVTLAWCYAGLRVAHSLVQATVNFVPARFVLFGLASFCLVALVVSAVRATLLA
jgi:hypothetical protein